MNTPEGAQSFPTAMWGEARVSFRPGARWHAGERAELVVVFARAVCGYVLAWIPGRGWTVPSGHVEPGEACEDAARRETWEEIGAEIVDLWRIGAYRLARPGAAALAAPAFCATVAGFGAIPAGSESKAARCFDVSELPAVYHRWDPLIESVFAYAEREAIRRNAP